MAASLSLDHGAADQYSLNNLTPSDKESSSRRVPNLMNDNTQISPFATLQRIQVGLKASFGRKEAAAVYLGLPARTLPDEQSIEAVEDRMCHEYVPWPYVPFNHIKLLMRMVYGVACFAQATDLLLLAAHSFVA